MKKKILTNSDCRDQLKTKAFTLIELLAIIVILAIIAVITVPIILNVIDNAKRGSIIDSAYGYKDAVEKYYVQRLSEDQAFKLHDTYSVSDGKLGDYDIPFTGMKPISGTLTYENSELKEGCLRFDDYNVSYDGSKFTIEKGICEVTKEIEIPIARTIDGVDYYETEWIGTNPVYYNPTTGASCTDYVESNSNTGNTEGCLKWYAYSEQNGNVNLLLDHNTTARLFWVTETDYNDGGGTPALAETLGITYPNGITGNDSYGSYGNWNKGPVTLLNQLKTDTSSWTGLANRTDSYINKNDYDDSETVTERYKIDYSNYKARIITAQEVANITGNTTWDETSTSSRHFFFDSHAERSSETCRKGVDISGCSYGWLYDRICQSCTSYGCLNNSDAVTGGYWTVSSRAANSNHVWLIGEMSYSSGSSMINLYYVFSDLRGLRPVITVPKSSIFQS